MAKKTLSQIPFHLTFEQITEHGLGAPFKQEFAFLTFPLTVTATGGIYYDNLSLLNKHDWNKRTPEKRREFLVEKLVASFLIPKTTSKEQLKELFNLLENNLHTEVLINQLPELPKDLAGNNPQTFYQKVTVLK